MRPAANGAQRMRTFLLALSVAAAAPALPAVAQDAATAGAIDQQAKPAEPVTPRPPASAAGRAPAREPAFTLQGFGTFAYTSFTATETFDAVLGSSSGQAYGGGVRVTHRSGFFGQVDVSRFSATGERVFVFQGEVFELGIPLDVTVTPVEFTGGYRYVARRRATPPRPPARQPPPTRSTLQRPAPQPTGARPAAPATASRPRFVPYVGGGIGLVQYEEESPFAEAGDSVSESFTSYHLLGGVDIPLWRWLGTGVEVNYRWVPDALGAAGVSKEFGETDLGGFTFRARVTIGR